MKEFLMSEKYRGEVVLEHIICVAKLAAEDGNIWTYRWKETDTQQLRVYFRTPSREMNHINAISHFSAYMFHSTYILNISKPKLLQYMYKICGGFDFIECFTTTFLRAHSWLNWVAKSVEEVTYLMC